MGIAYRNIPLRFLYAGLFYLLLGAAVGVLNITGTAGLKALHSHLMLAGFVSLTIVGAMYQLVPTILGTELRPKILLDASFILLNAGVIFLAYSFAGNFSLMVPAAFIYAAGALSFALIVFVTVITAPRKNVSVAVWYFVAAIVYYLAGIIYAALAFSSASFKLPVHSHLLAVGWIAMTTYGGLYELFPMLSLRKLKSVRLAYFNLILANAALIGMLYGFYISREVLLVSGLAFALSFYLLAANLFATLTTKSESQVELDLSVKFFIPAILFGLAGITLGPLNIAFGNYTFQHSHLLLAGWIALTIIGAEYHIIPMLTWMEKYASKLGVEDIPMIADLFNMKLGKAVLAGSILGVALLSYPGAAPLGGIILLASFLTFTGDMIAVQFR